MGMDSGRQAKMDLNPTSIFIPWPRKIVCEPQFAQKCVKCGISHRL